MTSSGVIPFEVAASLLNKAVVIVPAYNEEARVIPALEAVLAEKPGALMVVDDGSTDGTGSLVEAWMERHRSQGVALRLLRHERNRGKGRAIRTALEHLGEFPELNLVILHDADGEYDPRDWEEGAKLILAGKADLVIGSRFGGKPRRAIYALHHLANIAITFLANLAADLDLTDIESGMKLFHRSLLENLELLSEDFRIEIELVLKAAKKGARIYEIPISYHGRTYAEGKKIRFRDGILALLAIAQYR